MARGRTRTPTAILESRGAFKQHPNRRRKYEPMFDHPPHKPSNLDDHEEWLWQHSIKPLIDKGIAKSVDLLALKAMMSFYSLFREAVENEETITREAYRYWDCCERLMKEFGLTPAARSRIQVQQVAPLDPMAQLLNDP